MGAKEKKPEIIPADLVVNPTEEGLKFVWKMLYSCPNRAYL